MDEAVILTVPTTRGFNMSCPSSYVLMMQIISCIYLPQITEEETYPTRSIMSVPAQYAKDVEQLEELVSC